MGDYRTLTILHLSDLRFGRNHRFGRLGLPPPDDQVDAPYRASDSGLISESVYGGSELPAPERAVPLDEPLLTDNP